MKNIYFKDVKLGVFVLSGLLLLILLLYMIGRNRNMFGSNFNLRARFENVQGLKAGNNVRFSGIDIGTVKEVKIINDTLMEVEMIIDKKVKNILKKNAIVSITTDGLVGNKIVNITAVKSPSLYAEENDILPSKKSIDTDVMLRTLSKTNNDIAEIANNLKLTINKLNSSEGLWTLLNDKTISKNIVNAFAEVNSASNNINNISRDIRIITKDIKKGKGTIGKLIRDTLLSKAIEESVNNIKNAGVNILKLSSDLDNTVLNIDTIINNGEGTVHALMKDSGIVIKINKSLDNIQEGSKGFSDNMNALKHNILFRGYFRKLEKSRQKQ
jgi:phospholipid/cholesterol/gamma-HCH transport system substrate-binding protein